MSVLMQNIGYATAVVCLLLAIHLFKSSAEVRTPARLLALCLLVQAVQSVMVSLVLVVGRPSIPAILMPCIAMIIGPLFLFCFQSATRHDFRFSMTMLWHFVPALIVLTEFLTRVFWIDIDLLILLSFGFYTARLGWMISRGPEQFAHLDPYRKTIFNWLKICTALMAIALISEIIILIGILRGQLLSESITLMIVLTGDLLLVSLALLAALQRPSQFDWVYLFGMPLQEQNNDTEIYDECVQDFEKHIVGQRRYLEGDLNLKQIAAVLQRSPRLVSRSINHHYQRSVSGLLNDLRVEYAAQLLLDSNEMTITDVMFAAGFRTKSSFNKEFRARTGLAPSSYRSNPAGGHHENTVSNVGSERSITKT